MILQFLGCKMFAYCPQAIQKCFVPGTREKKKVRQLENIIKNEAKDVECRKGVCELRAGQDWIALDWIGQLRRQFWAKGLYP